MEINFGELIAVAPVLLVFVISGLLIYGSWIFLSKKIGNPLKTGTGRGRKEKLPSETVVQTIYTPPAQFSTFNPTSVGMPAMSNLPPIPNRPKVSH